MDTDIVVWRAFVTAAVLLNAFFWLRASTQLSALRGEIHAVHRLMLVWARYWGQPEQTLTEALRAELESEQ